jgi:hypothetical protein
MVVRFLEVHGIEKCGETWAAPTPEVKNAVHVRQVAMYNAEGTTKNGLRGSTA